MIEKSPRIEEWKKLFKAIIKVKDIAPWKWMYEDDLFAVQNPETDEMGFVSVMGSIGEHYAISVYLGERGLYGFWDLQESASDILCNQMFFEIPQLQAFFEDRNFLHPKDRELIKRLGLKFRGRQSWPAFRSYRPGFFPWFLESDEARFLQYALEQTADVSLRFKKDSSLLSPGNDEHYFARIPFKKDDKLFWKDSTLKISPPEPHRIEFSIPLSGMHAIDALKRTVPSKVTLEIDLFMSKNPVKEKDIRPFYPYILLMVEAHSGMVVCVKLLPPLPTLEEMWRTVPAKVAEWLAENQLLPKKILVNSELMYKLLSYLNEEFDISLKQSESLPNLDDARASLLESIE